MADSRKGRAPMAGIFSGEPLEWERKKPVGDSPDLKKSSEFVDIPFKDGEVEEFRIALIAYKAKYEDHLIFRAPIFAKNMNVRYQKDKWRMSHYPAGARFDYIGIEEAKMTPYNFIFKPLNESTESFRDTSDGRVVINLKKVLATLKVQKSFVEFLHVGKTKSDSVKKTPKKESIEPEIDLSELVKKRKERALCPF